MRFRAIMFTRHVTIKTESSEKKSKFSACIQIFRPEQLKLYTAQIKFSSHRNVGYSTFF